MTDTVVRLRIKDLHELSMESTSDAPLGLTIGGLIMDSLIETAIGYWLLAIGSPGVVTVVTGSGASSQWRAVTFGGVEPFRLLASRALDDGQSRTVAARKETKNQ